MNSKEALCEILKRTDKKESEYITKCVEIIIKDLDVLEEILYVSGENCNDTQDTTNEEKCIENVRPADIPYDKYMQVVRENEDLKETIVKLVKKLNGCLFFD